MTEERRVELTEDRIPVEGLEETIEELVELYGGKVHAYRESARDFVLPLRRGVPTSGGVECTLSWTSAEGPETSVTLACDRNVDAPRVQRIFLLVAGVAGALLFMLWPFYPGEQGFGTLAWIGGAIAIAVYLLTLRRASGGIAADFLQRLARRQRAAQEGE
jgi:hypothetical protein